MKANETERDRTVNEEMGHLLNIKENSNQPVSATKPNGNGSKISSQILKLNNSHNILSYNYNIKFEYVNYIASSIIVVIALISKTIIAIPGVIKLII